MKTQRFAKTEIVCQIIFLFATVSPLGWHAGAAVGADDESKPRTQNTIAVWDTGARSSEPLTPAMLTTKQGWSRISAVPGLIVSWGGSKVKLSMTTSVEAPLAITLRAGF